MADNENVRKSQPPKRYPQPYRPPPGVQKAIQTLGVRDLREILDKKRQEQGESQGDKRPEPKQVNVPPPDPSYNYLKDPKRDRPKPQRKADHDRPVAKDRELHTPQHRFRDGNNSNRENVQNYKDTRHHQDNKENNSNTQEKGVLRKNQNVSQSEGAPRKELRFSDNNPRFVEEEKQFPRGGRGSFRGRNGKRGGGMPRESKEEKIENPVNIKIQLSTETGLRNCTLDENTKIADIKHVPDKIPYQKPSRGGFRGSRGNFRGRWRGRSSFRGRGEFSHRGRVSESNVDAVNQDNNSFNMEELQKSLPGGVENDNLQSMENRNPPSSKNGFEENDQDRKNQNGGEVHENSEENLQQYDDDDQDNDDYNDANDNYDEYYSEYYNDSGEHGQNLDNSRNYESLPESNRYPHGSIDITDPNLQTTITVRSSKFQDEDKKRCVEVKPISNVTEKGGRSREVVGDKSNKGNTE